MSQITLERLVSGVLTDADAVVLEDETGAYGIKRNDTGAVAVAAGTAVTHVSTGNYAYDTSLLDPTAGYTAVWKVTTTDWGDAYVRDLILPEKPGLCTLADVERETAMRIGPYARYTCAAGSSSKTVTITKIKSTLEIGGFEDKYVLRRGVMTADGSPVSGFVDDDRQRVIVSATLTDGFVTVDRDYTTAPVEGEDVEIHYLDPEQELRPLVQKALQEHVRLTDRTSVLLASTAQPATANSIGAVQDITARCPWITEVSQIWELWSMFRSSIYIPYLVDYWKPFMQDGHVWVQMNPIPYPNNLIIDHWRWASTLVNGAYSPDGPTADADILHVNPMYAASGAHQMAFLYGNIRPKIMDGVRTGLFIDQPTAVSVFEDSARRHFKPGKRRQMMPGLLPQRNLVINWPPINP